ncbi:hypothetical protein [Kitasatospora sp. NPDC057541]|uniref:hypothetical protein n=1 Tax=unclassified Kitasatospora TaxID=2633591 RepID=UPI0036ACCAA4
MSSYNRWIARRIEEHDALTTAHEQAAFLARRGLTAAELEYWRQCLLMPRASAEDPSAVHAYLMPHPVERDTRVQVRMRRSPDRRSRTVRMTITIHFRG